MGIHAYARTIHAEKDGDAHAIPMKCAGKVLGSEQRSESTRSDTHARLSRIAAFYCLGLVACLGCATGAILSESKRLQDEGDLGAAYRTLSEFSKEHPGNVAVQNELKQVGQNIGWEALAHDRTLSPADLDQRLILLKKAPLEHFYQPELKNRIASIDKKAKERDSLVRLADESDDLAQKMVIAWRIREYRDYSSEVAKLLDSINDQRDALISTITDKERTDVDHALLLWEIAAETYPETVFPERARLKAAECTNRIGAKRHAANARRSPATAAAIGIVALPYCSADSEALRRIEDWVDESLNAYRPTVALDFDLPSGQIATIRSRLSKKVSLAASLPTDGSGILVSASVLDAGVTVEKNVNQKFSKFLSGYQQLANPRYNELMNGYNQAVSMQHRLTANGDVASSLAAIVWAVKAGEYRNALADTPAYLQLPIHQDYQYLESRFALSPRVAVSLRIWDSRDRFVVEDRRIERSRTVEKIGLSSVHPDDINGLTDRDVGEDDVERLVQAAWKEVVEEIGDIALSAIGEINLARGRDSLAVGAPGSAREYYLAHRLNEEIPKSAFKEIVPKRIAQRAKRLPIELAEWPDKIVFVDPFKDFVSGEVSDEDFGPVMENIVFARSPERKKAVVSRRPSHAPKVILPKRLPHVSSGTARRYASISDLVRERSESVVVIETTFSTGSGVIVDPKGLIVTNHHVVGDASEVIVKLADGRKSVAKVLEHSVSRDLALLKIETVGLMAAPMARTRDLEVGETVVAIGAPLGLEQTATSGIVSAVRRTPLDYVDESVTLIQTDAAINSGNSGGPLLNMSGEIVGINTKKLSKLGVEGLGFAVSVEEVRKAFRSHLGHR